MQQLLPYQVFQRRVFSKQSFYIPGEEAAFESVGSGLHGSEPELRLYVAIVNHYNVILKTLSN